MSNEARIRLRPRPFSVLRSFIEQEAAGGIVLVLAAVLAMLCANSALAEFYTDGLQAKLGFTVAGLDMRYSVLHWINDGLMAVFFLLVGLEIKRELLDGQLSTWSRRALPGIAALGGMIAPALIYTWFNWNNPEGLRGWAIPAATDIAFALGVLSLLGPRVPVSLKVFLTALAILDDLGAIVLIALFYTADLNTTALGLAGLCFGALVAMNRLRVMRLSAYLVVGVLLWLCMLKSGVHATVAGVALALTIPLRPAPGRPDDPTSPLHTLEHALSRPVAFIIVPLFGFANAGLNLSGIGLEDLLDPVPLGVALGLFVGKQIGVFGSIWAVVRLDIADLPAHATWAQVYGVTILCGIGFTMSLFIGSLAFGETGLLIDETKIGVLSGSILSALVGYTLLRLSSRTRARGR